MPHEFTAVKSPAVICAEISVNATSPLFVSVTCYTALEVLNCCAAKLSDCGDNPSVAGESPVPLNEAV